MVKSGNRGYHDRVAGRYDAMYQGDYWRFYREISWRHLKAQLPERRPLQALDIGCGTGHFGCRLLKAGCDVVFLDPSVKMLEQARDAAEAARRSSLSSQFVLAGMEAMTEVTDASIDFATGQGDPLSFCEDPEKALAELARVLRPDGIAVLSVDHRVAGVRSLQSEAKPDAMLELLRSGRTRWRGHREDERFPMKMFDVDELHALLQRAGFVVTSTIAKTCLVQRSTEAWLAQPETFRALVAAEERVHDRRQWFALGGHLQVAARRGS
jgi:ubiquinone/menaquinone biosynthesis C-methylase UbiE